MFSEKDKQDLAKKILNDKTISREEQNKLLDQLNSLDRESVEVGKFLQNPTIKRYLTTVSHLMTTGIIDPMFTDW